MTNAAAGLIDHSRFGIHSSFVIESPAAPSPALRLNSSFVYRSSLCEMPGSLIDLQFDG